jgi:hypothetical protein
MYLRNLESAYSGRSAALRNVAENPAQSAGNKTPAAPSRGAFFDMMVAAAPASPPTESRLTSSSGVKPLAGDENSTGLRGGNAPATDSRALTAPLTTSTTASTSTTDTISTGNPIEDLNGLLRKLGYEPSSFNARITSAHIAVPGLAYDYPLLEVTVNGERVGFHLPSALKDMRNTAANISSMMGRPVMNFAEFA